MATDSVVRNVIDLPKNVWRSVFRNPLPGSDLGRSQTTFTNLFLHIHPVKTHAHSLRPTYTLGLGVISLSLCVVLAATGFLLMFYYVPSVEQAHNRNTDRAVDGEVSEGERFGQRAGPGNSREASRNRPRRYAALEIGR